MTSVKSSDSGKPWTINYRSKSVRKKIKKKIKRLRWEELYEEYEQDVSKDPFRADDGKKIRKLRRQFRYPEGYYRYRKGDMRVVYIPEKDKHEIITVEIGSAGDIGYKRE